MPDAGVFITDGVMEFSGGVDSGKVTLVQSASNPKGVHRDQVCWATNVTMRGGGITQRPGWKYLTTISDGSLLYQGGAMYQPDNGDPYLLLSIGGHLQQVYCLAGFAPVDLSAAFGMVNPATVDQAYFAQGENVMLWQAGDYLTPAKWWNGTQLLQSNGIIAAGNPANQIPPAGPMSYYQGRFWYGRGRTVGAGDIIGGAHGILAVTENPLAAAGDDFNLRLSEGPIRAIAHSSAIDAALGEGQLFLFTRKEVIHLAVPLSRDDWTSSTDPALKVVQNKYGTPADRSVVNVNGDLFYVTMEPGVRTLAMAVRYFNQWANTSISRNMNRVVPFQDRGLLRFSSGILFDNRLYETCLPFQAGDVGVAHSALQVLDFDLVSSFQDQLQGAPIPAWEGINTGLDILQVFSGDFGGFDRAFAVVLSRVNGTIQLWELTNGDKMENGENRVTWTIEFPALDWNDCFQFKELQGGYLWMDRITGKVDVLVEYRSDDDACWHYWTEFHKCYARNSCEDLVNPICYPTTPYGEGNNKPITLPHPNRKECASNTLRPACYGFSFQVRLTFQGFARFRGMMLFASKRQLSIYSNVECMAGPGYNTVTVGGSDMNCSCPPNEPGPQGPPGPPSVIVRDTWDPSPPPDPTVDTICVYRDGTASRTWDAKNQAWI